MARKTGSERRDTNKRDPIAELEAKIARIKKQLQTSGSRGKGSQVTLLRTLENRLTQYKQNKAQFGNVWGNRRNENPIGRSVSKNKNNLKIDQNELKPNQYRLTEWTTDQEADEEGKIVEEGPIPTIDNKIVEEKQQVENTGGEVGENPNYFQQLGGVDQGYWMNGQWISNMTDVDRQNLREFKIWQNGAVEKKKLEQTGGQEYVTDYQTAIQNSRRDGLSFGEAEQYYGEDVLDSAGRRVIKSNVFTLDEDGNPMGVKTRKQRLALDLAKAEASIPKPDKTEDKKEDTSTDIEIEPNVGSEIKNEGKGGEVFTPPTPLSEEYKSLFNPTRA